MQILTVNRQWSHRRQGYGGQARVKCFSKGFTLIEVLLVMMLIGLLAGIGIPVYHALQTRNDLDIAATAAAQNLRRAQILAQAVDGDAMWGLRLDPGSIVVFKGSSFATRDPGYDETFTIGGTIALSGLSEVVFSKATGLPQTTGTIILTSSASETRTITINAKGAVSF